MPNFIPYLVLMIISIVLLVLSGRKAANKKWIVFYLCMAGVVYLFEFIVLVLFKCYVYIPGVFKDPYFDNILGANVSDGFIVPLTTVFIAVYDLGMVWISFIVLCFVGIEELVLYLEVYKHYWWKTIYTAIGLPIQFALGKWIWHNIRFHGKQVMVRFGVLYFANITIQATLLYYLSAVTDLIYYRVDWFNEPTRGHIAFGSLFAFIASIFFSLVVVTKAHYLWNLVWILCLAGFNVMLFKWGILEVPGYGTIAFLSLGHVMYLLMLHYFNVLLEGNKQ